MVEIVSLCDRRHDLQVEAVAASVACFKLAEPWPPSRPAMAKACRAYARDWIAQYGYPPSKPIPLGPDGIEEND